MVTLVRRATWQQNREKGLIYEICNRLAFLSLSKKCQWQWAKQTMSKASLKLFWTSCHLKSFQENRGRTVGLALVSELSGVDKAYGWPWAASLSISVTTTQIFQESIPQEGHLLYNWMVPPKHRDGNKPDYCSPLFWHIDSLIESLQPLTVPWDPSNVAGTWETVQGEVVHLRKKWVCSF